MEALSFLSGGGIASNAKYFDIRLEDRYVVFRGNEQEAASAHLQGTLVLCLSEPLTIKHLRLHLTGMSRVCWYLPSSSASGARRPFKEKVFFEKTWKFREAGKGRTETLAADNYEFPFDVILEGSLPESVEGLHDTWITYRFKAEIGRKYARDIIIRKPLRIIRTLDANALELAHAMSVENIWPNKIEYSISTPSKAVVFGTSVRVNFRLISLLKGLRIGMITSQVIESHDLTLNPDDPDSVHSMYKSTRIIKTDEYELDEESQLEILDESAEGYQFHRFLELPKTLSRCLQDTDTKGIKIRHKLKFRVQLHNPDGHTSELRATLPVSVYISPNLAIDDNNNLIDQTPEAAQMAMDGLVQQAPPLYGEHQFDQLYSEVDVSGYRTPGVVSGAATPFGTLSRNLSAEDLPSMAAVSDGDISASALHSRLIHLHANGISHVPSPDTGDSHDGDIGNRSSAHGTDYFTVNRQVHSHSQSPEGLSAAGSSRASDEHDRDRDPLPSGMVTPHHPQYMEVENLSRVPSYSTAIRCSARTPCNRDLPDYMAATAGTAVSTTPRSPQQVHLRGGGGRYHFTSAVGESCHRHAFFHIRDHSHSHSVAEDEERRLRLIQARARG